VNSIVSTKNGGPFQEPPFFVTGFCVG